MKSLSEKDKTFLNTEREAEYLASAMKYQNQTASKSGTSESGLKINGEVWETPIEAMGTTIVLRKRDRTQQMDRNGLVISQDMYTNFRASVGVIESIGSDVVWDSLEVGAVVIFDTRSVYRPTFPIVWTKQENIIAYVEDEHTMKPIGDYVLAKLNTVDEQKESDSGLIIPNTSKDITPVYTIVAVGPEVDNDLKEGDEILVQTGDDFTINLHVKGEMMQLFRKATVLGRLK